MEVAEMPRVRLGYESDLMQLTDDELRSFIRAATTERTRRKQMAATGTQPQSPDDDHISWNDAKRILNRAYLNDSKAAFNASRLWGMLARLAVDSKVPVKGRCIACGYVLRKGEWVYHNSGCISRPDNVKTTLAFSKQSLAANTDTIRSMIRTGELKSPLGLTYKEKVLSSFEQVIAAM
jgi:hypothetical protein